MQLFNGIDEVINTGTVGTIFPLVPIPDAIDFLVQSNCATNTRTHLFNDVSLYMQEVVVSKDTLSLTSIER